MAKTTTVTITDDIDGSAAAEEISFSYRGTAYTIDLSKKNAAALDKALKPYLAAATKVPTRAVAATRGRRPSVRVAAKTDVAAIRAWAAEQGHTINTRGRIPKPVVDAYNAATKE
ncbi:iron-regulated nucleoid-associated protein Lsr2 [Acidothermaceae bacterium B102]|nr:iron-regulated nucleoid-associated protein Lsr2 [Acidothermaceae bacterium B102]